jgi:transcriptional/translational regulatory protein YebC/TACO1
MNENSMTRKMLDTLRKGRVEQARKAAEQFVTEDKERDNFLTQARILMEEAVEDSKKKILTEEEEVDDDHKDSFEINKGTPQFGDVRVSQEEAIRKAINNNVQFSDGALKYYPKADDMTLDGKIPSLNLDFQFRYNDPSGDGCYVWTDAMQLTDTNARTIGKIRDAFSNWKDSITQDGDLMEKLKKAAENKD